MTHNNLNLPMQNAVSNLIAHLNRCGFVVTLPGSPKRDPIVAPSSQLQTIDGSVVELRVQRIHDDTSYLRITANVDCCTFRATGWVRGSSASDCQTDSPLDVTFAPMAIGATGPVATIAKWLRDAPQ